MTNGKGNFPKHFEDNIVLYDLLRYEWRILTIPDINIRNMSDNTYISV